MAKSVLKAHQKRSEDAFSPSLLNSKYAIEDSNTLPEIPPIYAFQTEKERDKLLKKIYKKQITKRILDPGP